jgi:methionyl-tRNA formyltransferase
MKVIFMGTPEFAVSTLEACMEYHEVVCVFTQPDRPSGRGKKLTPPPIKSLADKHGIPVFQPERIKKDEWVNKIIELEADVIVVVAYGQILSKAILEAPKYGSINVHASLLPKYRGAAPINWSIVRGETETGITTMQMDVGLDTGDMLLKKVVQITPEMNAGQLHDILSEEGASLLIETLAKIEEGGLDPQPQNHDESTYAPMIYKNMANLEWSLDAEDIANKIRGFNPWPVCYTTYAEKRLKIFSAIPVAALDEPASNYGIGAIVAVSSDDFTVKCGKGYLSVKEIQYGNGKRMPVKAFLLGHQMVVGTQLKEE